MKRIKIQELITACFYQVLYISIIATVIGLVILGIKKLAKGRISPKCMYIIWTVFLFALIFPIPIPSRLSVYNYVGIEEVRATDKQKQDDVIDIFSKRSDNSSEILSENEEVIVDCNKLSRPYLTQFIIPDIWFAIFVIKLIGMIYSYIKFGHQVGKEEIKEERIIKILEKCKARLKIKRKITILKQDIVKMPAIIGVFHVKLLFTDDVREIDDASLSHILMHELSHYKRKDNLLKPFIMFVKCVHWFNLFLFGFFHYIKRDMEFATDEMAISTMEEKERTEYCKTVVQMAGKKNFKIKQVLGMASRTFEEVNIRINVIRLEEKFEKHAHLLFGSTIGIVLLMLLILYPTSYGMNDVPKLYLRSENGTKVETTAIKEDEQFSGNSIHLKKNETVKLITKGGKCEDYIIYSQINLTGDEVVNSSSIVKNELSYLEAGEYLAIFTLSYGKNQTIDYAIKMIVEER